MVSNKSGGGVKIANNLITTEEGYVLDARQGKILDEKIVETKNDLLKMIQASGTLFYNYEWNNYTTPGVYKVQGTTMTAEYHAPVGLYGYGTLVVLVAELSDEFRTIQIYFPDSSNGNPVMAIRMRNVEWQPWYKIAGQLLQ